jgi:drug/metabolite transporter (DMT)-like permease
MRRPDLVDRDARERRTLQPTDTPALRVHAALLVVALSFGSAMVIGKIVLEEVPPLTLVIVRVALGASALLAFLRLAAVGRRDGLSVPVSLRRDGPRLVLLAILGVVVNQALFFMGLARTTPVHATLIQQTISPMTLALSLALGRERFSVGRVAGIGLAFAGAVSLVARGGLDLGSDQLAGDALIFLNAASYAVFLVLSPGTMVRLGSLTVSAAMFAIGTVLLIPISLPTVLATDFAAISARAWAGIAFIVAFPTILAYLLSAWALARAAPSLVSAYIFVQPFVAVGLDAAVRGTRLGLDTIVPGALILAGVAVAAIASKRTGQRRRPDTA